MDNFSKTQAAVSWFLQLLVAGVLLQTLFFKFTGAEESVYIFTSVGRFFRRDSARPLPPQAAAHLQT